MSGTRCVLASLALAMGGLVRGQELPTAPPVAESPAVAPGGLLPPSQELPASTALTGQEPPASLDPAKTAATLEALTKGMEALKKNLTVVTGDEKVKVVIGGTITGDFYFNQARPVAPGVPFFLAPPSPFGFSQNTFDATARQSTLFALVSGPKIGDFESGGFIAVCFFNSSIIVDQYGILPVQGYVQLKNDDWRFAAGLQFDIFNPLNPNMLTFSLLGGSGNTGAGFPAQFRVERYLHPSDDSQITLTLGLSDPISTTVNNNLQLSEDNGWPNVEGRAAFAFGALKGEGPEAQRPFEVGVSGLVGQIRTTSGATRVVADVWGLGTDLRWSVTPRFGFQGEGFVGQTLGTYTGGILQNVNSNTFQGIRASGGWAEVYYYICPDKLHTHIGYGIDDPLDRDLAPGQPVRNDTYFANLIWDVTKNLRLGCEVTYRKTAYTLVGNNQGVGFQTQVQLKF
jgi:hypothetical protein